MIASAPTVFPNRIGAVLPEQNDEWQLQHRYMQLEAIGLRPIPRRDVGAADRAELMLPIMDPKPQQILSKAA